MKNNTTQKRYNEAINLMSHLVLTKPKAVLLLLKKHGSTFDSVPSKAVMTSALIEGLRKNTPTFMEDLGKLLTLHIQYKGKEMLALEGKSFSSYEEEGEGEDAFWGAIAKVGIGLVGSLFKKKSRGGGGNSQAVAQANAQAAAAKRDMMRRMDQMRAEQRRQLEEAKRREEEARRRQEEESRRRREEEARRRREEEARRERELQERKKQEAAEKAKTKKMLLWGAGAAAIVFVLLGVVVLSSKKSPPVLQSFVPPSPINYPPVAGGGRIID